MIQVLITVAIVCLSLMAIVLTKPNITIKGKDISIYWVVVLAGAVYLLAGGFLTLPEVAEGLTRDAGINPIKILVLFISMTSMSVYLDEAGLFGYLATIALLRAKSSQLRLFVILYLLVSVLTVFTSNDIIILTFTPFICYFAKSAGISPMPYLFAEFVAANTFSMMLIIGNPTNIYLAGSYGLSFGGYTRVMLLPTCLAGAVAFLLLYLIFKKELKKPIKADIHTVQIKDPALMLLGLIHLTLCTILLVISSYIGLSMWLITLCFALSLFVLTILHMLIRHHYTSVLTDTLKRLPWELIPFVLSMFVLVLALDKYGLTREIAHFLGDGGAVFTYGFSSFLSANLINNIPMSVLFSSVISHMGEGTATLPAVFAAIAGSNIGAYLTPLGALAGIMWSGILKKHEVRFSFLTYIRYGICIAPLVLLVTLLGLWIVL